MTFFISFSSQDREVVRLIAEALRLRHPSEHFFLDQRRFTGGNDWLPELGKGLEEADAFLLLIGETIGPVKSKEYDQPVGLSLSPDRMQRPRIIPVAIVDRPFGGLTLLSTFHRIFASEFFDRGLACRGRARACRRCGRGDEAGVAAV